MRTSCTVPAQSSNFSRNRAFSCLKSVKKQAITGGMFYQFWGMAQIFLHGYHYAPPSSSPGSAPTCNVPYPCERGPTMEYRPTPHFGINFLLRSKVLDRQRAGFQDLDNSWNTIAPMALSGTIPLVACKQFLTYKRESIGKKVACLRREVNNASTINQTSDQYYTSDRLHAWLSRNYGCTLHP
jgi:hypothetical protein